MIYSDGGADTIWGHIRGEGGGLGGDDTIYGGDGMDGDGSADIIFGQGDDDLNFGEDGDDTIDGGAGDDLIYGQDDWDTLEGGADNDEIYGGNGNDSLQGNPGHDRLYGDADNDTLFGGSGDDLLYGRSGDDEMSGEVGSDTYIFDGVDGPESTIVGDRIDDLDDVNAIGTDTLNFAQAHGGAIRLELLKVDQSSFPLPLTQQVNSSLWLTLVPRYQTINGQTVAVSGMIEKVIGTPFDDDIWADDLSNDIRGGDGDDLIYGGGGALDTLDGGNGYDVIWGENGADSIMGGNDSDILLGGAGADTIDGGNGWDIGRGGAGADVFFFNVEDPDQEADTVKALPIDLQGTSDTGVSQTDNLTNDTSPTFDVIAVPGTFVELYRATTPGGTGPVVASMTYSERGLSQLTDNSSPAAGTYYYYITVADDPTALKSQPSDQLAVTIDTAGPQVTAVKTLSDAMIGSFEWDVTPEANSSEQIHSVHLGATRTSRVLACCWERSWVWCYQGDERLGLGG